MGYLVYGDKDYDKNGQEKGTYFGRWGWIDVRQEKGRYFGRLKRIDAVPKTRTLILVLFGVWDMVQVRVKVLGLVLILMQLHIILKHVEIICGV